VLSHFPSGEYIIASSIYISTENSRNGRITRFFFYKGNNSKALLA